MENVLLYHGSKEIVKYPEIRLAQYNKDFYFGFYCTTIPEQAERWATRMGKSGYLNIYEFNQNVDLKHLIFSEMTEEWLEFIVRCRLGKAHNYDIVEGPMANDTIFNYVQDYVDEKISRNAFWELARFKRPTHQISFHTVSALSTLTYIRSEEINGKK